MKSKKPNLYVIGSNTSGQLALNDRTTRKELTWNPSNVELNTIHCGDGFCIFVDNKQNYWSADKNSCGHLVEYFKQNNINIIKICTTLSGATVFWITNNGNVYGHGDNRYYQLGTGDTKNRIQPELIPTLKNVVDIQSAWCYSIALCKSYGNTSIIVNYWCIKEKVNIANEIINLIEIFYAYTEVYSTGQEPDNGGHGHGNKCVKEWTVIKSFNDKNIIKIRTGRLYSLFLDADGTVYCCGKDAWDLGLRDHTIDSELLPIVVPYFTENNVKIKEIKCGFDINLAIDDKNKLYSWDYITGCDHNDDCYCSPNPIPKLVESLKNFNVLQIGCGATHYYAYCDNGKHYLWGSNKYNECLDFDSIYEFKETPRPFCINQTVLSKTNGKIKQLFVGYNHTHLIVE